MERRFFQRDPLICAREMIGCLLVSETTAGRIVETEAYDSEDDPACHTFFRPSARNFVAEHPAGTAYVYLNYGVHWLFNVLVKGQRSGFVLVRALEPVAGIDLMMQRRNTTSLRALCSGPGKLTQALAIDRMHHGIDVCAHSQIRIEPGLPSSRILADPRIGISAAQDLPWRFTLEKSPFLSKLPKLPS